MKTLKFAYCAITLLCLAATISAQVNQPEPLHIDSDDAKFIPDVVTFIPEDNLSNQTQDLPRLDEAISTSASTTEAESSDFSFEDVMNDIHKKPFGKPPKHHGREKGEKGFKHREWKDHKEQKEPHHRRGNHEQFSDKKHEEQNETSPLTSSSPTSSENQGQNYQYPQSSMNVQHSRRFKKGGKIFLGIAISVVAIASLFCCIRCVKRRRGARKNTVAALTRISPVSQQDQISQMDQESQLSIAVGTPIQVPSQMTMVYSPDGNIPFQSLSGQGAAIGYYVMPQQFSHPALANNHQVMQVDAPTLAINSQAQPQVAQQVNASKYPVLNNQETVAALQPQYLPFQQQQYVAYNFAQIPHGYAQFR